MTTQANGVMRGQGRAGVRRMTLGEGKGREGAPFGSPGPSSEQTGKESRGAKAAHIEPCRRGGVELPGVAPGKAACQTQKTVWGCRI
jgi:hypothetical protein